MRTYLKMSGMGAVLLSTLLAIGCDNPPAPEDGGPDGGNVGPVDGGPLPVCGDGTREGTEMCDDGNTTNGDGCSSTCQVEAGTDAGPDVDAGPQTDAGPFDGGPDSGIPVDAGPLTDAGTDAGPIVMADAGTDGGMDAGTDAGSDAGTDGGPIVMADAGTDAGPIPVSCPSSDIGSMVGAITGTTTGAGNDTAGSCQSNTNEEVALRWVAPNSGRFVFDTEGTSFGDSVLYVLDDCGGTELACDDDDGTGLLSSLTLDVVGGEDYIIVVDGFGSNNGDYTLNITELVDTCLSATDVSGLTTGAATGDLTDGSFANFRGRAEIPTDCSTFGDAGTGFEAYFTYTATAEGTHIFQTDGNGETEDTIIYALDHACDGLVRGCDDDGGAGLSSLLSVHLVVGQTIILVVDSYAGADLFTLDITPPATPDTLMPALAGDLVISEFHADPDPTNNGREWIEIVNVSGRVIDLNGCILADGSAGGMHPIAGALTVDVGQSYVLAQSNTPGGFTPNYDYDGAFTLNNGGSETITLTCSAVQIDTITYSAGAGWPVVSGSSSQLDPASTTGDNNDPLNWCATAGSSYDPDNFGSPGVLNEDCI